MPTEQQIRELAYEIWEEEGRPEGRDQEHYFRAKELLEQRERPPLVDLTTSPSGMRLEAAPQTPELPAAPKKRRTTTTTRRKKS